MIIEAVRTPSGRQDGILAGIEPSDLLGWVQATALQRAGIDPSDVDQVIAGCGRGGESGNIGRHAWLAGGLPPAVPAMTLDLPSGASLHAAGVLAGLVASGTVDIGLACGVEVMSSAGPAPGATGFPSLLDCIAGERVADHWSISRAECDAFGFESRRRARRAWDEGWFDDEVVAIAGTAGGGAGLRQSRIPLVTCDEGIHDTTIEEMGTLQPIVQNGVHTAATCSPGADQGSAIVVVAADLADDLEFAPGFRIVDHCRAKVGPALTLTGPIDVTFRLLERNRLRVGDIDVFEVNEVFAAVVLAWARELHIDLDRVNPSGGGIALGHPLGSTGVRLLTTAVHELERLDGEWALVTMSGPGATGIGTLLRRI